MATTTLTTDNFQDVLEDHDIVLVDFWASWCGPCRTFGPIYEEVSDRHDDIVFGKVDTEAQPELTAHFGIRSIPTLMAFREGVLLYAQPGAVPGSVVEELIAQIRQLDMDAVRAELDAHEREHDHEQGGARQAS